MQNIENEIRIPVTIGGVTFKNPFFVASGPTTKSVRQLKRIEETGWAAASIKLSIDPAPYINRKPRYALFKEKKALAFTAEKRLTFEQGLTLVREAKKVLTDLKLFANITYAGDAGVSGWVNMAKKFEEAGADIIELNMCCPNMSYNVNLTSGGSKQAAKQTGASLGQQADAVAEIVRAIKKEITIPLFVKLTPEGGQIAHVAQALYEAGADAVGGTANRLGIPDMDIDNPTEAIYHLQDEISMSCYCGSWVKPLGLRDTYEIRKVCGPEPKIMAAGGITNWKDAVEMILCGGNLVGICSETLISGYDIVRPMLAGLKDYMDRHSYKSIDDFCGLIVPAVKTAPELTLYDGYARIKEPRLSGPCKAACPLHVPVQGYVAKIAEGDFRGAYDLIMTKGLLQSVCAYVCPHPCEDACTLGDAGDPVKIRELKKFVLEKAEKEGWNTAASFAEPNGHSVAVIGGGASGLSAATELAKAGYKVTLFDRHLELGGELREAVGAGLLPETVLEKITSSLDELGIAVSLGTEATADGLAGSYDAVITAEQPKPGLINWITREPLAAEEETLKDGNTVLIGNSLRLFETGLRLAKNGAKLQLVIPRLTDKTRGYKELAAEAASAGLKVFNGLTPLTYEPSEKQLILSGKQEEKVVLKADAVYTAEPDVPGLSLPQAILKGLTFAADTDKAIRGADATVEQPERTVPVKKQDVLKRNGYLGDRAKAYAIDSDEAAVAEASRCLKCGCGEGCQLCKTICTDFAPYIAAPDTLAINREECVACGMCFNRCPNHNIEMVNLGNKV